MRSYGIGRPTYDLDLWVARDTKNAQSLNKFLHKKPNAPPLARIMQPELKLTVGDPRRPDVDILNSVAGDPSFDEFNSRSKRRNVDGQLLPIISPRDLRSVKLSSAEIMESDGRNPDLPALDRENARRTAEKERRDIMLIDLYLGVNPNE
jgi:hypothetical protein